MRQTKKLEFINFIQKNMTISEYMARFSKLANFMTKIDLDDAREARYSKKELRDNIMRMVKAN